MDETTPSYNLSVVVRETGVKPDTLRAWERRYGLPEPVRTEGGHRLYSDRDIAMIKWFIARQDEGMRISQVVKMWQEMESEGVDPLNPSEQAVDIQPVITGLPADSALVRLRETWVQACLAYNEFSAEQILSQAFARYPVELVVIEVLQKGIAQIGEGWYEGNVTVQQEHFASALALRRLNALISAAPVPTRRERILVGTPPGELHVFSPLLVVLFSRYAGWDVAYLGADVPLFDLEKAIEKIEPDLVVYTAAQMTSAASLLHVAFSLSERDLPFAFGGRAFSMQDNLIKFIPGYYLGNTLQGVSRRIGDVLSGRLQPNRPLEVPVAYHTTLKLFEKAIPSINAQLINNYGGDSKYSEMVERINHQFTNYIRAGLTFGDLSLVNSELTWAEVLIDNNQMADNLLGEYLQAYQSVVGEVMGDDGKILQTWLAGLNF